MPRQGRKFLGVLPTENAGKFNREKAALRIKVLESRAGELVTEINNLMELQRAADREHRDVCIKLGRARSLFAERWGAGGVANDDAAEVARVDPKLPDT